MMHLFILLALWSSSLALSRGFASEIRSYLSRGDADRDRDIAMDDPVTLTVSSEGVLCNCNPLAFEFEQFEMVKAWCRDQPTETCHYPQDAWLGEDEVKQQENYCLFDQMNWLTKDRRNVNYKNFFSYIDAGATELNMLQAEDVCKAEASAFLLDNDSGVWNFFSDAIFGENFNFQKLEDKIACLLGCLQRERLEACKVQAVQQLEDACPTVALA